MVVFATAPHSLGKAHTGTAATEVGRHEMHMIPSLPQELRYVLLPLKLQRTYKA